MEIYLFDFDDTLFITNSKLFVINPKTHKIIKSYTTNEYRINYDEIQVYNKRGYIMDYSETSDKKSLETAIPNKKYKYFLKNLYRKKKKIGILTSRGVHPIFIQRCIYKHFQILIPLENIICVNHEQTYRRVVQKVKKYKLGFKQSLNRKKNGLIYFIGKKYEIIHFFDDDDRNIAVGNEVQAECKEKYYTPTIFTYLVRHSNKHIHS
jgi:hypothetical protein